MDAKELRELIEIISRSNFATFELEREGFKLKLVRQEAGSPPAQAVMVAAGPALPPAAPNPAAPAEAAAAPAPAAVPSDGLVEMTSPIVGTFYSAPSPTASAFVQVGSRVKKGDVLCIVEAMKLMNEIESEIDAEIAEIVPSNGQPVEYGEVLFRLKPLG